MFSLTSQGERGSLILSVIVTSNKWLFLPKWMKSQSSLCSATVIPLIPSDLFLGYPCVTHMTASQILASFRDFHGSVLVSFLLVLPPHLYITSYLDFFFHASNWLYLFRSATSVLFCSHSFPLQSLHKTHLLNASAQVPIKDKKDMYN